MKTVKILSSAVAKYGGISDMGNIFLPDLVARIVNRYLFWEFPRGLADFDLDKGARFTFGKFRSGVIESLVFYNSGFLVEGPRDTKELHEFCDDLISWAEETFSCKIEELSPVSYSEKSVLEVEAPDDFSLRFNAFSQITTRLNQTLEKRGVSQPEFHLHGFSVHPDALQSQPIVPTRFVFERRAGQPLESNRYFTEAPLSTSEHIELLAEFEKSLS